MRRLPYLLPALLIIVLYATAPSFAAAYALVPHAATRAVLYQIDFSQSGLAGWGFQGKRGWKVTDGVLSFDGRAHSEALAPFQTVHLHDFAVEADIQSLGTSSVQGFGYGLIVRGKTAKFSGIQGGMALSYPKQVVEEEISWNGLQAGGAYVQPHDGFNSYRLEVHGASYTLFVDGLETVQFRIDSFRKGTAVGIWSGSYKLLVRLFRVFRLSRVSPTPKVPALGGLNLKPADVPHGLQQAFGYYWTDDEVARDNQVTLATVTGSGRIATYEVGFEDPARTGFYALSSFLGVFSSSEQATVALARDVIRARFAGSPGYTEADVPELSSDAFRIGFRFEVANGPTYDIGGIFFHRGRYMDAMYATFTVDVPADQQAADMITLAKVVYQRIPATQG
jgi:hypothetical protein